MEKQKPRQMCISQDCATSWRQNQEINVWKLTADRSFLSEHIPNGMHGFYLGKLID